MEKPTGEKLLAPELTISGRRDSVEPPLHVSPALQSVALPDLAWLLFRQKLV